MTKQIDWVAEAKKSWKLGYEQGRAEMTTGEEDL